MINDKQKKSGFVALVGRPNVGKSTLMNRLIGQKIAITSEKPQTTRNRIRTILTEDRGQIVFLDTPGIHRAKNKLGEFMVNTAVTSFNEVDIVLWLVEPSTYIGPGEQEIIARLKTCAAPVVLVINKVDKIKPELLVKVIEAYRSVFDFKEIVPLSAMKGENTDCLLEVLFDLLDEGPFFYDEDEITDQPERQIVAELIREKALRCLSDEIPHGIAVSVDLMKERREGGFFDIDATIVCERESHKGIIIGKQGAMLKKIGTVARKDIEKILGFGVNLKLWVKVKKDWRDSDFLVRNYGYRDTDSE